MLRSTCRATVRSAPQRKTGTYEGRDYDFTEVEVVDSDLNKTKLRVQPGTVLDVGATYDFVVDTPATKHVVVHAQVVK